jgi:hypothetical protein
MACRRIAVLALAGSLLGCVEEIDRTGSPAWTKADATLASFQKDTDECQRAAALIPIHDMGPTGRAIERHRRYMECMTDRGWTLEPQRSDDSMKAIVDCKLPSAEQPQRLSARDCHNKYGRIIQPRPRAVSHRPVSPGAEAMLSTLPETL